MRKSLFLAGLLLSVALFSGLSVSVQAEDAKKAETDLSVDEQNRMALEAYEKILELSSSGDRQKILPQLEAAYYDVIAKYPKSNLAQETYWRLIQMYLGEYQPPLIEKAEKLHTEFLQKYPDTKLRDMVDRALVEGYVRHGKWEKVLTFLSPSIKQSIESGKFTKIYDIFMYTEAKYRTGDFVEAEKGYKIVIANFPKARESAAAKKRLEEIESRKNQKP